MTTRTYKDGFTLDGRLRPGLGVSKTKVAAVQSLLERHNRGDDIATATLKEALTTSDAVFNLAYLANLNFLPEYDKAPRNWRTIATTRTAPDLRPITLWSMERKWTNDGEEDANVLNEHGAAPVVPEGSPYPYAYMSQQSTPQAARVVKRGFKTDWTLESRINDNLGVLDRLPQDMLEVSLDTEEADVWGALVNQVAAYGESALEGGNVPNSVDPVLPNAPFSRDALIRAIMELSEREINGRKIQVSGGYNLIVPVGQKVFVEFQLNQSWVSVQDGNYTMSINGYNPLAGITVVESEWVTGTEWYLMPKPGNTRRPVLERLNLRGYIDPQLFVANHQGVFIGGSAVSPFEGSFDADVITLKLRQFGGGVVWDQGKAVVYSDGTGEE